MNELNISKCILRKRKKNYTGTAKRFCIQVENGQNFPLFYAT